MLRSIFALVIAFIAPLPVAADISGVTLSAVNTPAGTSLWSIAAGPDENLWALDIGAVVTRVGHLNSDGSFTGFPLAGSFGTAPLPWSIVAGPDGNLWFTVGLSSPNGSAIGRVTPSGTIPARDLALRAAIWRKRRRTEPMA